MPNNISIAGSGYAQTDSFNQAQIAEQTEQPEVFDSGHPVDNQNVQDLGIKYPGAPIADIVDARFTDAAKLYREPVDLTAIKT